jgi:hypothetical protein
MKITLSKRIDSLQSVIRNISERLSTETASFGLVGAPQVGWAVYGGVGDDEAIDTTLK